MESENSSSRNNNVQLEEESSPSPNISEETFSDRFESLLPKIQERWPDLARQTLEATRGSVDEVVKVISEHSGYSSYGVKEQLEELINTASDRTRDFADSLEPLEKQLEDLLDELNSTLRPRIERPVRKRPLLSIGMAAGIGLLIGLILAGGRRD